MTQEIVLNTLIIVDIIITIIMLRHKLQDKRVRIAIGALFCGSAAIFLVFAVLNTMRGNFIGAVILFIASLFFLLETYASSKWKTGELYPGPKEWFERR